MGGAGVTAPLKLFPKKKMEKSENMKYFHAYELSKLAFLSSLTRKYIL